MGERQLIRAAELVLPSNPLLKHIATDYLTREPDWDMLVNRFLETPEYRHGRYDFVHLAGYLSELQVRLCLEQAASGYGLRVRLDPIVPLPDGDADKRFGFIQGPDIDNLVVLKRRDGGGAIYSEIDQVMVVDDLPTLIEVKLGSGKSQPNKKPSSRGFQYTISSDRVEAILAPIKEYFGTDIAAFVLVGEPELAYKHPEPLERFEQRGGIFVPFYSSRSEFIGRVRAELERFPELFTDHVRQDPEYIRGF